MKYLFSLIVIVACFACDPARVYEQNHDIDNYQWYIDSVATFRFSIEDASQPYHIYYNVRNAISYPYYNLYVTYYLTDSTGKQLSSKLQELTLMDPQTGKPLGDGLGDIFDHQIVSVSNFKFPRKGEYIFKVKQYMRKDPLPGIMSMGIRVEKAAAGE